MQNGGKAAGGPGEIKGQRGRRKARLILGALLFLIASVAVYYAWEVAQARDYTRESILPRLAGENWEITARDLTPRQLDILLKVEDPAFFTHGGVDLTTPGAGLTTLTQGLVKILYFDHFQPGIKKIRQTLIAWLALDSLVGKEDQLTLFLNLTGLGQGARGFPEAARHYYGKEFKALNEDEFLSLLAMVAAPRTFNLRTHPERNALRVARIKEVTAGTYHPKGLCDIYYGPLDRETQEGLAPMSYFESYYRD